MLGEKHDLVHELPEYRDRISALKASDNRFSHLFDKYHLVEREVYRIEMGSEAATEEYLGKRKKERLLLKDQLFHMLCGTA